MSIIFKINTEASKISETDLKWIVPELMNYYSSHMPKLYRYAYNLYGDDYVEVAKSAFSELASETLEKALRSFLFNQQHWRSGRDVNSYLLTCLNRLAKNIRADIFSNKKTSIPICPVCKLFNQKEYLIYDNKMLRCDFCINEISNLEYKIKNTSDLDIKNKLEFELRIRNALYLHSRSGYRCPDCSRFIPKSYINSNKVSCPYDNDCFWFGTVDELEKMSHPIGITDREICLLNETVSGKKADSFNNYTIQDSIPAQNIDADVHLQFTQNCEKELKILREVINTQSQRLDLEPEYRVIKKKIMYQAFKNMLDKNPYDMISYLVHQNHCMDLPIQARIFQEFISIVENSLPIEILYNKEIVEIYSIQDPRLGLLLGQSEFKANVRKDFTIPNNTLETYIGGRKSRDFGPCFIGRLLDVICLENNKSILDKVEYYTFSQIKLNEDVPIGLSVLVKHFRILSHYEMNGLVQLQKIRRKIVDSVYFKLHKKRRKINS